MTDTVNVNQGKGTEAEAIAELAVTASEPTIISEGTDGTVAQTHVPVGWKLQTDDFEYLLDQPRRTRGTVELHDEASFVRFVQEHSALEMTRAPDGAVIPTYPVDGAEPDRATKVYANIDTGKFVAVFNDAYAGKVTGDRGTIAVEGPGWADHRAVLTLRLTPEWNRWTAKDGHLMEQSAFANHIEDSLLDIHQPDGGTMLEMAQTFLAKTAVNFKSSQLINTGQRQFVFEETTTASAGHQGDIKVPTMFTLGLAPYDGMDIVPVEARLRFEIRGQKLSIGYKLVNPHIVLRDAFVKVGNAISEHTLVGVLRGEPPVGVAHITR